MDGYLRDEPERPTRFGRSMRTLALVVVIALILLTVVPVLIRVSRPDSVPTTTTTPGTIAVGRLELGTGNL